MRHAHAGDREHWRGDDRSRPLTEKGQAQARGLAQLLSAESVDRVMSSPYRRCIQTVEPLAAARGLALQTERLLAEGADWRQTLDLVCDLPAAAVMCSQGDVIGGIVMSLVEAKLLAPDAGRWQKGSTWVLDVRDGRVRAATYLAPVEA